MTVPSTGVDPNIDYSSKYLTFEALEDGTFQFTDTNNIIQYSIDNGNTWVNLAPDTNTPTINTGSKIMWKMNNPIIDQSGSDPYGIGRFISSGRFNAEGNIMSLLFGDNFVGEISLNGKKHVFRYLFFGSLAVNSKNLILPATTLSWRCYENMFLGCTLLVNSPQLPATTLAGYCYSGMFSGCTCLITAPELPATTLAEDCYSSMFYGCTSLTIAPRLPATTLAYVCYSFMFKNCISLVNAPELPATNLTNGCYEHMFEGCTSLTIAPTLPVATLTTQCYKYMFYGCTSLSSIKCLATNISASGCTNSWVDNVAASGTFTKAASMTSWTTGMSGIPSGWTVTT